MVCYARSEEKYACFHSTSNSLEWYKTRAHIDYVIIKEGRRGLASVK